MPHKAHLESTWEDWLLEHSNTFETQWERNFARHVLPRIRGLQPSHVTPQRTIHTSAGNQRRVDFAVERGGVRLAVEVDGYDKTGSGRGQSAVEFRESLERDAELRIADWRVVHIANQSLRNQRSREQMVAAIEQELKSELQVPQEPISEPKPLQKRWPLVASGAVAMLIVAGFIVSRGAADFCPEGQSWTEAKIGQHGLFYGPVVRVGADPESEAAFIDIGRPYPDPSRLTLVIFNPKEAGLPEDPQAHFGSKDVCVTGLVEEFNGARQIVVEAMGQLRISE